VKVFYFILKILFIYERETEREEQREKDKQTLELDTGLNPMALRSQPG